MRDGAARHEVGSTDRSGLWNPQEAATRQHREGIPKLASDRRIPVRKLVRNLELASYVIDGLHRCWSPGDQLMFVGEIEHV